jgi:hypothetical protein
MSTRLLYREFGITGCHHVSTKHEGDVIIFGRTKISVYARQAENWLGFFV